ncbi:hypothetical protein LN139_12810 [Pseudomonas sp. KNUC1026]|nr:hypothetical protein LN139_12810 [Pseudomonas sp. KNUC1026]
MQATPDPLAWLQDATSPRTLQWLADENARTDHFLRQTEALREQLYEEIHGRYQAADLSVPTPSGPWLYYFQKQLGQAFSNYYRCPLPADGSLNIDPLQQQLLLAPDALAHQGQIAFGTVSASPDHRYLAYSVLIGQQPGLYVQNLEVPQTPALRLPVEGFDGSLTWASDSQTLLCAQANARHSHRLLRYRLGDAEASAVFEETDDRFDLSCTRSRSGQWLLLHSIGPGASEVWVAAANDAQGQFSCLISRTQQRRARLDHGHWGNEPHWFCLSAQAGGPAQLMRMPSSPKSTAPTWQVIAAAEPLQAIERMVPFASGLLVLMRDSGQLKLRIFRAHTLVTSVEFPDSLHSIALGALPDYESTGMLLTYESFTHPGKCAGSTWAMAPSAVAPSAVAPSTMAPSACSRLIRYRVISTAPGT